MQLFNAFRIHLDSLLKEKPSNSISDLNLGVRKDGKLVLIYIFPTKTHEFFFEIEICYSLMNKEST